MSRIFTDEELQEMIIPTTTRIRTAYQTVVDYGKSDTSILAGND